MRVLLLTITALLLSAQAAFAAEAGQVPTDITAERMTYLQQGQMVIFEGAVKVTRPDFLLTSDRLTVLFEQARGPEGGGGTVPAEQGEIKRIEAEGRVRLEKDGRVGLCSKAVFDLKKQLITMEGDPVIEDGKNRISGALIRFHLADNRSEVLGDEGGRVKATFFTPERSGTVGPGGGQQ